jgi:hypothetical protein
MSAEARRRISDAQKARWAKQKGEAPITEVAPAEAVAAKRGSRAVRKGVAKRGPRKMSAAARKRISDAQKKRWAAKRKAA